MKILGLTEKRRLAIIGLGNLGMALANYNGFSHDNFEIAALFDDDPEKIGKKTRSGLEIHDACKIGETIKREFIEIVIIAVPASAAEKVLEEVTGAGVHAVLNFAPVHLNPRPGVKVKNVDLTISLESLSYFLANPSEEAVNVHYREFLRQESSSNGTQSS
jgi:redox-sensing transcriptional repressor